MEKRLLLLVNPNTVKADMKSKLNEVVELFHKNGYNVTVHATQGQLEAIEYLDRHRHGFDLVVSCGGDGTMNETLNGLMKWEDRADLGCLPAGTVNDFAASMEIPKNIYDAARLIVEGVPFPCDVGCFNGRYFIYVAAFGVFSEVPYKTTQQAKNILGRAAYIIEGLISLQSIKSYHMVIEHDNGRIEGDFIFGMATNSSSVGGFKIGEKSSMALNDGLFEVLLIRKTNTIFDLQVIAAALLMQQYDSEYIHMFKSSKLDVTSDEEVSWTVDGEFGGSVKQAIIQNEQQAINFMVAPEMPGK